MPTVFYITPTCFGAVFWELTNFFKTSSNKTGNNKHTTTIAHLRQECHNQKFGIFDLLVQKETLADALLKGIVS